MDFKLFPAFFDHPEKIKYCQQETDEHIELFLRRHFIVNVPWIVISIILFIIPLVVFQIDQIIHTNLLLNIPVNLLFGGLIIWYMLILTYVLENFIFWYFNIYIVTNKHLIDINYVSLLYRDITEIHLNDIETVSSTVRGIFGPLFNFGLVTIETAAENEDVKFVNIPKPDFVVDRIQDLRESNGHE